jgi:hypothetical protein
MTASVPKRVFLSRTLDGAGGSIYVKLLRQRLASGKRVPLLSPTHPLGSPFRACNVSPLLESIAHHFAVFRGR